MMEEFLIKYNNRGYETGLDDFYFDLQLFAAEDEGKTEEPTEKKLREAREKGQVAKTPELSQSLVVIMGVLVIFMFSSWIYDSILGITKYYLSSFSRFTITERVARNDLFTVTVEILKILTPVFIAVTLAGIAGNIVQVGFQVSTHPLKVDWSKIKLDPATIMKKVLFSKQVAMNLFKSIFKVLAIGIVAYMVIYSNFEEILKTPDISLALALQNMLLTALKIVIWTSVLLLALSIPDYIFQKQEFIESLKMSKQEIKEELKETMGDPHLKAKLREMQRDIVMKNMIREVPGADVVVTNPTHFAIALKYEKETMEAPTVIAKGADSMALRIRGIARENNVAIIENRPLAQEMYKRLEIGDIIPEDLFYAVSLVYAELYKKKSVS